MHVGGAFSKDPTLVSEPSTAGQGVSPVSARPGSVVDGALTVVSTAVVSTTEVSVVVGASPPETKMIAVTPSTTARPMRTLMMRLRNR